MKTYPVNEVFVAPQGEGARAGLPHCFVRFAACNLTCSADGEAGFDCDTEFASNVRMTADELMGCVRDRSPEWMPVLFTGGEPLLHLDEPLIRRVVEARNVIHAVETNGTIAWPLPGTRPNFHVSCCPKSAEHTLRIGDATGEPGWPAVDELRYVRHAGQGIPQPRLSANLRYLSPAWSSDPEAVRRNLDHARQLVERNWGWRLSVQFHKLWGTR